MPPAGNAARECECDCESEAAYDDVCCRWLDHPRLLPVPGVLAMPAMPTVMAMMTAPTDARNTNSFYQLYTPIDTLLVRFLF